MKKRILITGATGLIGTHLCKELSARGDILTAFTRDPEKARIKLPFVNEFVHWNYKKPEEWKNHLNNKNAVIHLAGANLFAKRWTEDYKKKIIDSREIATQNIAESFNEVENKPKVFISASATGYYGDSGERDLVESVPPGNSFTAEVCKRWEAAAVEVEKFGVRRVSLRTATVFNKGKGAVKNLALPFKFFIGGTLGNGQQWFPWIHIKDLVRIYLFAIDNEKINGSVNAASPHQVRMKELTDEIGRVLHRSSFFKVPGFALKIALGEFADELLISLKVVPKKLEENNFNFLFGDLKKALKDLLK